MVYGPWILIDLLGKSTDTMALLYMAGAFVGIFFIPWIGRMLDKYGVRTILHADALSFIGVYLAFGVMSAGFNNGSMAKVGLPLIMMYLLFIVDKMSTQMGMVRSLYLRSIAISKEDITKTLATGVSLDHSVTVVFAFISGLVWEHIGPQYVFFFAAAMSLGNLFVARKVEHKEGFARIE